MISRELRGPAAADFRMCAVGGCPKRALARGLCTRHYQHARRDGSLPERIRCVNFPEMHKTWLDPEAHLHLAKMSRVTGRTCSDLIRDAVERMLFPAGRPQAAKKQAARRKTSNEPGW